MNNYPFPSLRDVEVFRKALHSEQGAFGPFMITSDPAFVEAAGYAGYDFVLLDMEHGPGTFENLQNLIRAANVSGVCPVVRIPRGTDIWIDQALDVGAGAIMIPQIDSADQARAAHIHGLQVDIAHVAGQPYPPRNSLPAAPVGPAALSVPPPMVRSPVRITLPRHRTPW